MKYVAYYRVSTKKQGESGLGLEAQEQAVKRYVAPNTIYQEFTEIETGTNKRHRPILKEALELCKSQGAILIIAKLDRLARNVAFVSHLMDSGVKFKAVDMPEANELTINIMSSIAQHEAKVISTRIKEALAIKKLQLFSNGKKLGTPKNLTLEARKKGLDVILNSRLNNENRVRAIAFIRGLDRTKEEYNTLQKIANQLTKDKFKTSNGKEFSPTQVSRLIKAL